MNLFLWLYRWVQNLQVMALPEVDQMLETQIAIKNQVFDITVISRYGKV